MLNIPGMRNFEVPDIRNFFEFSSTSRFLLPVTFGLLRLLPLRKKTPTKIAEPFNPQPLGIPEQTCDFTNYNSDLVAETGLPANMLKSCEGVNKKVTGI